MRAEYVIKMERSGLGRYNPLSSKVRFMDKKEYKDLIDSVDMRIKAWADREGLELVSENEEIEVDTEEEYLGNKDYVFARDFEVDVRLVYLEMFAVDIEIEVEKGDGARKVVKEFRTYLKAMEDKLDNLMVEKKK
jgi:hypothetical protein